MLSPRQEKAIRDHFAECLAPVKRDISLAVSDLYNGPLYLDRDGEVCSMFDDEYSQAFDFSAACARISDALADVSTIWFDAYCECVEAREPQAEEVDGEVIEPCWSDFYQIERGEVLAILLGRELARHV